MYKGRNIEIGVCKNCKDFVGLVYEADEIFRQVGFGEFFIALKVAHKVSITRCRAPRL